MPYLVLYGPSDSINLDATTKYSLTPVKEGLRMPSFSLAAVIMWKRPVEST